MARKMGGSIAAVETIRKRLDLSQQQFSEALGFGTSAYGEMVRSGQVSITTALAAEALMRRQAPGVNDELAFVVRIVKGAPLVTPITDAQTIVLNDQRYLLIPAELPRPLRPEFGPRPGNGAEPAPGTAASASPAMAG